MKLNKVGVTKVHIFFDGMYEWGHGWVSHEIAQKWHEYWASLKPDAWNHGKGEKYDEYREEYLYGLGGSVYLHPMSTTAFINTECSDIYLTTLKKVIDDAAKNIGFTYRIEEKEY